MELTKKQIILIVAISGAILLLTAAAALFFTTGDRKPVPETSPSPTATASSVPTPTPTIAPTPTTFLLPLVPQWDASQPTAAPMGAGAFAPQRSIPPEASELTGTPGPWAAAFDGDTGDILAVGLQDGRAAALLMLRLSGDTLTVAAFPEDALGADGGALLPGDDLNARGAKAASLAEGVTGRPWARWMALDLGRLPELLSVTGPLGEGGALSTEGIGDARGSLSLMTGAIAYLEKMSLLELPALKRAVGDGFESSLSARELWSFFWTIRSGVRVFGLLPAAEKQRGEA